MREREREREICLRASVCVSESVYSVKESKRVRASDGEFVRVCACGKVGEGGCGRLI